MKPKPGGKPDKEKSDLTDLLMRVIDVQSRCIEALAIAVGATPEVKEEDEGENGEEEEEEK